MFISFEMCLFFFLNGQLLLLLLLLKKKHKISQTHLQKIVNNMNWTRETSNLLWFCEHAPINYKQFKQFKCWDSEYGILPIQLNYNLIEIWNFKRCELLFLFTCRAS